MYEFICICTSTHLYKLWYVQMACTFVLCMCVLLAASGLVSYWMNAYWDVHPCRHCTDTDVFMSTCTQYGSTVVGYLGGFLSFVVSNHFPLCISYAFII